MVEKYKETTSSVIETGAVQLNNTASDIVGFAKSKIFDIIAIGIIVAMMALVLGVFEGRPLTWSEFKQILLECVPFYLAATMLSINYYTKGAFKGKASNVYMSSIRAYSEIVNQFSGGILSFLTTFCDDYNEKELIRHQTLKLKSASITYELYANGDETTKPLRQLGYFALRKKYGKAVAKAVMQANRVRVKGVSDNKLLGNLNIDDNTNVGSTEAELRTKHIVSYSLGFMFSIFFMSFLVVKNILEWGWVSLLFMSFKLLYVIFRSYMRYFDGYNDITIHMTNHYNRKSDILKQCMHAYDLYTKENIKEEK